ncbi:MAG: hypothetical protein EU539_06785 [Promethearchaeota archaeon]|nr:MAG: hypothetical protein EU539_06785 [Candidatus Lokiarchaeota archaeon]
MNLLKEKEIFIDDSKIYLKIFRLYKSYLLLISDQKEMGIGNVTLGSPPMTEGLKSISSTYNLFGLEKKLLSTMIAERASQVLKAPVLLLFFLKKRNKEKGIVKPLIELLNETLNEIENENKGSN